MIAALLVASSLIETAAGKQEFVKEPLPGIRYVQEVSASPPLVVHTVRFRAPENGFDMEAVLARDRVLATNGGVSRETVSSIARRTGAMIVVNADFFGNDGDPLGLMIRSGRFLSEPLWDRAVAAWADSTVLFDNPRWEAAVVRPDGTRLKIDGVNRAAKDGEVILYTQDAGSLYTKFPGHAAVLEPRSPDLTTGTIEVRTLYIQPDVQALEMPQNRWLLLGAGKAATSLLRFFRQGETWRIENQLTGSINWSAIRHALGGGPLLVKDSKPNVQGTLERFQSDLVNNKHPRSALGTTKDGEIVLVVVDGRTGISGGVTLQDLANLMIAKGCQQAINLDGGGSSALWVAGGIVNYPSDGRERPVANAFALFAPHPVEEVPSFEIATPALSLPEGGTLKLTCKFQDGSEVPAKELVWSSSGSAWVDQGGTVRALAPGSVTITAWYRGRSATATLLVVGKRSLLPTG